MNDDGENWMSEVLRVDTDELRTTADKLDMYAADLGEAHEAAHADAASAVAGFGAGLSAAALVERIGRWERETAEHQEEIGRHGIGHRSASAAYTATDSTSSEHIVSSVGL